MQLGAQSNANVVAVNDSDLILSGDVKVASPFGYEALLEKVRMVSGGIRLHKTSKSESEGGVIKVAYSTVGELNCDYSIQSYFDKQLN